MRRSDQSKNIFSTLLLAAVLSTTGIAQANDEIASNAIIDRVGLTVEWFSHSGAGANGKLVDWHLNVNENKATTFFTITGPGKYAETFSQNKLDAFGKPYGIDGGVEHAEMRKEILTAEYVNEGIKSPEIKITQYMLPETSIYTLTSDGRVRAIDGDTGKTKWETAVGTSSLPSIGIGSNNNYVAAVNGSTIYCLEASTGKTLWSRKCRYAVASSPAVSDERVFVPLTNGRLESFSIEDKGVNSLAFVEMGEGTARPMITEKTVSWTNSRGNFNVAARYDSKSVAYQLRTDESIVCSPTYSNGTYFITSLDGFIYALDEERGTVSWQVSTDRGIAKSPIVFKDHVFVINEDQLLYKLKASNGMPAEGWLKPRSDVKQYLGAGKDKLYVVDRFGRLKVISQESGVVLNSVNFGDVDKVLENDLTDRIYIASKRGMIQCIRERSRPIPYFHTFDFGPEEGVEPEMIAGKEKGAAEMGDGVDPFNQNVAAEVDPFGDAPKSAESNPFGEEPAMVASDETNPFGDEPEMAASDETNPFGDDPASEKTGDDEPNPFGQEPSMEEASSAESTPAESSAAESTPTDDDDDPFK